MNSSVRWRRTAGGLAAALCLALVLAWSGPARACGGFFSETTQSDVVVMSDVRVALVSDGSWVEQYVQVGYSGKANQVAWVYPVQQNPTVDEEKDNPFPVLEAATRPQITITTPQADDGGGGFGCGASDSLDSANGGRQIDPTVKVWQSGKVGAFDYVVISATKTDDMVDWLNKNGFSVPTRATTVLSHYVTLGWYFVAMKISVQAQQSGSVPATTVVKLGYAASEVRYPLRMVSLSNAAQTSFEFYLVSTVKGSELSPKAPFAALNIDPKKVVAQGPDTHNYETVFADTLKAGGSRALVREYSNTEWPYYKVAFKDAYQHTTLTRLRGTFTSAVMDQDIVFDFQPYKKVSHHYDLTYTGGQSSSAVPLPPLALVLLLGLGFKLWARRSAG